MFGVKTMSVDFNVTTEIRTDVGKGASRRLRHAGKVPGVVYGAGKDAVSLTIEHDHIMHHLAHEAFYSHVLSVSVNGSAEKAVLKDVQRHPSKPRILHVDFLRVSDTEKISMYVPLHFINEENAPGVKLGSGIVAHLMSGVDIICLAKDLPEYLEIDVANLETGDSLHLSDIKLPQGVEIPALAQGEDHDVPVVAVNAKKAEEEEEIATPVDDEPAPAEPESDA
jgi:large subunit ribosomal protein L25